MKDLQVNAGFDLAASQRLLQACHAAEQPEADMLARVVQALGEGADPNAALPYEPLSKSDGYDPCTPLMAVVQASYPQVLACLIEAGAWAMGPPHDPPDPHGAPTSTQPWHPLTSVFRELGWAVVEYQGDEGKIKLIHLNQCAQLLMAAGADPHTVDPGTHKTAMTALLVTLRTNPLLASTVEADNPYGVGKLLWAALNTGAAKDVEERLVLARNGQWNMLPVWSSLMDIPELSGWLQSYVRQQALEPLFEARTTKPATPRF